MARKNLLSLHEAIVVALITLPTRSATFEMIAQIIISRNLITERKGNIDLAKQVMLRTTKSKGKYFHLFEQLEGDRIRLRNLLL